MSLHERLAHDFVQAYEGDAESLQRLNEYYRRCFSLDDLKAEAGKAAAGLA